MEEQSQDLLIPKTVKDYKEFIFGEGFNNSEEIHPYLDIMSDDVDEFIGTGRYSNDTREDFWAYYTWQPTPEVGLNNEFTIDNAWGAYYHKILISNLIINDLPTITGSEREKNSVRAEAYFLRAWSYFMLANIYGKPYVKGSASSDFCVPINTEIGAEDKSLVRATVEVVYQQIVDDLLLAISNFKDADGEVSVFRPNLATAYLLLSRVYLFMQDYDKTVEYATLAIDNTDAKLINLNTLPLSAGSGSASLNLLSRRNPEIMYSYGNFALKSNTWASDYRYTAALQPSAELISLYVTNEDLRAKQYYTYREAQSGTYKIYTPMKWHKNSQSLYAKAFRLSEAYINRAEAYAQLNKLPEAQGDLNKIRENRFKDGYNFTITLNSKDIAIKEIADERRREFAFEELRWFDLRRYGMPRISRRYSSDDVSYESFELKEGSLSYILPLPRDERNKNLAIKDVDRPDNLVE